jgi:hypothetical protein
MASIPAKGTEEGQFFHRGENKSRALNQTYQPAVHEAEEELETNVCSPKCSHLTTGCAIQSVETRCFAADV